MLPYAHDHRLVQTAVVGDKHSDHPVILPMDADELDLWRARHPSFSYWCGLELGGCGGELSDKRYTEKVCHFAHHPDAPVCSRVARGESSADHLFIKRGVQRLMDQQRIRGDVRTRDLGGGPGDAVDVHLPDLGRRIRFQLGRLDYRGWRDADDELSDGANGVDWVFGPGVLITRELLGSGYCLRVGCETSGGERLVRIGATTDARTSDWTPLDECALSPSGISSPEVESIRISAPRPKPAAFPVQGSLLFALLPEKPIPTDSPFTVDGRHLVVADVRPTDSPIVRTVLSLPSDMPLPPTEHVYEVRGLAHVLVRENSGSWAITADKFVRLDAHTADRSGLRRRVSVVRSVAEEVKDEPVKRASAPEASPSQAHPSAKSVQTDSRAHMVRATPRSSAQVTAEELVVAVRDALEARARGRSTTSWRELTETVKGLAQLTMKERDDLLVDLDTPLRDDVPVLSVLLRDGIAPPLYMPAVLERLGVPPRVTTSRLKEWVDLETARAFAAYSSRSRIMPERFAPKPKRLLPKVTRSAEPTPATSRSQATTEETQRLRELTRQVEEMRPSMSQFTLKRADKAVRRAEVWLSHGAQDSSGPAQNRRKQRGTGHLPSYERCRVGLEKVVAAANRDVEAKEWLARFEESRAEEKPSDQPPQAAARPIDAVEELTRQLIGVALRQESISLLDVYEGRTRPDHVVRQRLMQIDRVTSDDVPLLSSVVTNGDGGPVPYFREILENAGLAVPTTDQVLHKVWRREQERAHAAYANPPRPLPERLVPRAS